MATTANTPNASLESPPSRRQRAKSFVKRIRRKSSQLFKRHHHSDESPSPRRRSTPTISALVVDSTRSAFAISVLSSSGSAHDARKDRHNGMLSAGDSIRSSGDSMSGEESRFGDHEDERSMGGSVLGDDDHEEERGSHVSEVAETLCLLPPSPSYMSSEPEEHGPTVVSPLPAIVEPHVPDPFVIDDPESSTEENSTDMLSLQPSFAQSPTAAEEISLAQTSASTLPSPTSTAERNHPLPPLPASQEKPSAVDSDDSDEEIPDLYIPALTNPTMFLPIPNTDPLTTLLNKYIVNPEKRPVRDLIGEWQRSEFHELVMSNGWRGLARMARDRLVATNPEDLNDILPLWYLRLSCLARLRLFNQTSAECTNLFSVLNSVEPASSRTWLFERLLPFELEVLQTRLKYWAGDPMGYLDVLYALLKKCKSKAKQTSASEAMASQMWQERGSRVCLITASQFLEMKDYVSAISILEPLCTQTDGSTSPDLRSAVGRIYLQAGLLDQALRQFAQVAVDPNASAQTVEMNTALMASAEGDWPKATQILQRLVDDEPDNFAAANNLSVALLSQGQLKTGIQVLEKALREYPLSIVTAEPFLFNLSTLYELRASIGMEKKRALLVQVARQSGDGLRTTCLKMPTN